MAKAQECSEEEQKSQGIDWKTGSTAVKRKGEKTRPKRKGVHTTTTHDEAQPQ